MGPVNKLSDNIQTAFTSGNEKILNASKGVRNEATTTIDSTISNLKNKINSLKGLRDVEGSRFSPSSNIRKERKVYQDKIDTLRATKKELRQLRAQLAKTGTDHAATLKLANQAITLANQAITLMKPPGTAGEVPAAPAAPDLQGLQGKITAMKAAVNETTAAINTLFTAAKTELERGNQDDPVSAQGERSAVIAHLGSKILMPEKEDAALDKATYQAITSAAKNARQLMNAHTTIESAAISMAGTKTRLEALNAEVGDLRLPDNLANPLLVKIEAQLNKVDLLEKKFLGSVVPTEENAAAFGKEVKKLYDETAVLITQLGGKIKTFKKLSRQAVNQAAAWDSALEHAQAKLKDIEGGVDLPEGARTAAMARLTKEIGVAQEKRDKISKSLNSSSTPESLDTYVKALDKLHKALVELSTKEFTDLQPLKQPFEAAKDARSGADKAMGSLGLFDGILESLKSSVDTVRLGPAEKEFAALKKGLEARGKALEKRLKQAKTSEDLSAIKNSYEKLTKDTRDAVQKVFDLQEKALIAQQKIQDVRDVGNRAMDAVGNKLKNYVAWLKIEPVGAAAGDLKAARNTINSLIYELEGLQDNFILKESKGEDSLADAMKYKKKAEELNTRVEKAITGFVSLENAMKSTLEGVEEAAAELAAAEQAAAEQAAAASLAAESPVDVPPAPTQQAAAQPAPAQLAPAQLAPPASPPPAAQLRGSAAPLTPAAERAPAPLAAPASPPPESSPPAPLAPAAQQAAAQPAPAAQQAATERREALAQLKQTITPAFKKLKDAQWRLSRGPDYEKIGSDLTAALVPLGDGTSNLTMAQIKAYQVALDAAIVAISSSSEPSVRTLLDGLKKLRTLSGKYSARYATLLSQKIVSSLITAQRANRHFGLQQSVAVAKESLKQIRQQRVKTLSQEIPNGPDKVANGIEAETALSAAIPAIAAAELTLKEQVTTLGVKTKDLLKLVRSAGFADRAAIIATLGSVWGQGSTENKAIDRLLENAPVGADLTLKDAREAHDLICTAYDSDHLGKRSPGYDQIKSLILGLKKLIEYFEGM